MVFTSVAMIIDNFDNVATVYLFRIECFKSPLLFAFYRPYFRALTGIFLPLRIGPVA